MMFKTDRFFASVVMVLAVLFLFAPAKAATVLSYISPNDPEIAAGIPENTVKTVIMSLPIADVVQGDLVVVISEMQATNMTSQWAMFCTSVILADSPTANTGQSLTESTCANFNANPGNVHHLPAPKNGMSIASAAHLSGYVNFLAWAATDPARNNWSLRVDKGYGKISVLKIRP